VVFFEHETKSTSQIISSVTEHNCPVNCCHWSTYVNAVGIAIRYTLDDSGIESRWKRDFSAPVQTGPGAHPASYTMGTGTFPGISGRGGIDHPPYLASRLKKEYIYTSTPPVGLRGSSRESFSFNWRNTTKAFVILYVLRTAYRISETTGYGSKWERKNAVWQERRRSMVREEPGFPCINSETQGPVKL
jgi:hypothetical protein